MILQNNPYKIKQVKTAYDLLAVSKGKFWGHNDRVNYIAKDLHIPVRVAFEMVAIAYRE